MASENPPESTGLGCCNGETQEEEFKQFDVVSDYSDHKNAESTSEINSSVSKKIMKEWKILQENLPESIYVRAYEQRIDLLRAVIVGSKGTPYHDGLFFFDISFPSNYPNSPPLFNYRSYGIRVNPKLYTNGYVCLSILNTWSGSRNERWDPSRSSILQILVSIQGIVLNDQPYYNEPGMKPAWNWRDYNEDVFGLNCKTMIYVLQRPPKNFQSFVVSHFLERASHILKAMNAYKDGIAIVGLYDEDKSCASSKKVSKKFRETLIDEYPKLFQQFSRIGAHVEDLRPLPVVEKKKPKKKKGVLHKFVGVVSRFWNHIGIPGCK